METKRIYRSASNRMIGGVAGGLSEYLNVDATIIRLVFAALTLLNGFGALLYLILWLLIPAATSASEDPRGYVQENVEEIKQAAMSLVDRVRKLFSN